MTGGYDDGYDACSCFWGTSPGSYVERLVRELGGMQGRIVLDAGCGEGKNSEYLADLGARVFAIDTSQKAITNARTHWAPRQSVQYRVGDVRNVRDVWPELPHVDIVVAYGMLHCLGSEEDAREVIASVQGLTAPGGYHVVCAFNSRRQELQAAHPGFAPLLLPHEWYLMAYGCSGWLILESSDSDLREAHPHNGVEHVHSMTRLIARRYA